MTQLTPPPEELLDQWEEEWHHGEVNHIRLETHIAARAAQWGADQELEACCEWLKKELYALAADAIRDARRPPAPPETIEVDGFTYKLVR